MSLGGTAGFNKPGIANLAGEAEVNTIESAELLIDLVLSDIEGRDSDSKRIIANRIIDALLPYSNKQQPKQESELQPMTDAEAKEFGSQRFAFGKHCGELFCDNPEYLAWLCDTKRTERIDIHRYLNNPQVKRRRSESDD
jgi:hypothetical protein